MMSIIVREFLIPTVIAENVPMPRCFVKLKNLVVVIILKYIALIVSKYC